MNIPGKKPSPSCSGSTAASSDGKDRSIKKLLPTGDFDSIIRHTLFLIPIGVGGNLILTYFKTDRSIFGDLSAFSLEYLALAAGLGLVPWLTNTLRNQIWLRFQGEDFSLWEVLKIVVGMDLGAAVSPTAVGGGYVKMAMYIQKGVAPGRAASLMMLGTAEDLTFFLLAVPFSLIWTGALERPGLPGLSGKIQSVGEGLEITAGLLAAAAAAAFLISRTPPGRRLLNRPPMVRFRERGRRFLIDFLDVYRNVIRRGRFRFLLTLLLTAVQWICRYSVITALLACFQVPLQPVRFFLYQWFVFSIMTFTPTPGAAVGAEAGFVMVYGGVIPGDIIGLATAGWRILTFYLQLSLGMIVFSLLRMKSPGEGGCERPRDKILKTAASS